MMAYVFVFYANIQNSKAAITPGAGENTDKYKSGSYTLNDLMRIFVNIGDWILGIVGSLTLIMFVYGGFLFLFSGGNNDRVTKGKQTLTNATIGLFIVFLSYMIVGLVFNFADVQIPNNTSWSKVGWFNN